MAAPPFDAHLPAYCSMRRSTEHAGPIASFSSTTTKPGSPSGWARTCVCLGASTQARVTLKPMSSGLSDRLSTSTTPRVPSPRSSKQLAAATTTVRGLVPEPRLAGPSTRGDKIHYFRRCSTSVISPRALHGLADAPFTGDGPSSASAVDSRGLPGAEPAPPRLPSVIRRPVARPTVRVPVGGPRREPTRPCHAPSVRYALREVGGMARRHHPGDLPARRGRS